MSFLREHVVQRWKKTTKNHLCKARHDQKKRFHTFQDIYNEKREKEKKQAQNALFHAFCSVCVCASVSVFVCVKAFHFPINGITHCSNIPECNNLFILIRLFSHMVSNVEDLPFLKPIVSAHTFYQCIFLTSIFLGLSHPPTTPPTPLSLPPFSYHQISDYTKGLKPGHAAAPFHLSYCCLDLEIKRHSNLVFDKGFLHPFFCIGLCCIRQLSCSDVLE